MSINSIVINVILINSFEFVTHYCSKSINLTYLLISKQLKFSNKINPFYLQKRSLSDEKSDQFFWNWGLYMTWKLNK